MRAFECSGPAPSYPWGRSSVSRVGWPHFDSPETMKLSMITWAALAKSPNCASQRIRLSGEAAEYPYSNPTQAISESGLL